MPKSASALQNRLIWHSTCEPVTVPQLFARVFRYGEFGIGFFSRQQILSKSVKSVARGYDFSLWQRKFAGCMLLLAVLILLVPVGCVRRRMTIRSNPDGALAIVDDREIGLTPVSADFTDYGTRNIQLVKDGFETTSVKQTFFPPWYQFPVLDFFAENLVPWEYRDEHLVNVQMAPQQMVSPDAVVERAEELRTNSRLGQAPVLPDVTPPPTVTTSRPPAPILPPLQAPAAGN